jgi:hypothetical protein
MKQIINLVSANIDSGRLTGILLILCTVVSLFVSNSPLGPGYIHFWHLTIPLSFLNESIEWWINDGLMAIFFFMVGIGNPPRDGGRSVIQFKEITATGACRSGWDARSGPDLSSFLTSIPVTSTAGLFQRLRILRFHWGFYLCLAAGYRSD